MRVEEQKKDSVVQAELAVEPNEIVDWLAESDKFADGVDWEGASQEDLKSVITSRAEYELLNERVPSPLTRPLIVASKDVIEGAPFSFSISFAELPQSELVDYSQIELAQKRPEVTDEEVQKLFESTIGGVTATTPKGPDAVVEDGDTVDIALESVSDGRIYHPLTAAKRYYSLGSGFMPKDFDDMLRGMKVGDVASVNLKVPKSESPMDEPSGFRDVRVTVTVNNIMLDTASSVDDAWIRSQFPGVAGVDELKNALRQQLLAEKESMYSEAVETLLLQKLAARLVDGKLSDAVLEMQACEARDNIKRQLEEQGRSFEGFLKERSMDEKQLHLSLMMDIRDQDRQMMALDAWARRFGLTPADSDYEKYRDMLAREVGVPDAEEILGSMYKGALDEAVVRMMAQHQALAS